MLPLVLGGKHRRKSLEALPLFGRRRESFCDPAARVVLAHQNTAFETHPAIHPYIVLPANAGTQLPLRAFAPLREILKASRKGAKARRDAQPRTDSEAGKNDSHKDTETRSVGEALNVARRRTYRFAARDRKSTRLNSSP